MFGLLFKYTIHLCPEVQGRVTYEGKPIADLEVSRSLTYSDEDEEIDTTITDNNGCFSFPEAKMKSRLPGSIFHVPVIRQVLYLSYQDQTYVLWYATQWQIKPCTAYTRMLKELKAELTQPEIRHDFDNLDEPERPHVTSSICRWDTITKVF
ncbi:DUF6795 domain-containing protein [Thalassomonas actiniarum]|uniref:Carboxypeptidase regulatory-like domain-containing protein n=1 Tax=Thalassomonas actiniarum TaxID=485447 RepID=A0AAE9YUM4_9GAMM|nr:DUF6795 domain-containing protein [Thalassomonas actiniarum]WDE01540.1 carboxypeptidase regulatory-like domain-containing protein [Thalassomonas actiniarum]